MGGSQTFPPAPDIHCTANQMSYIRDMARQLHNRPGPLPTGGQLRGVRRKVGLTQEQLAIRAGLTRQKVIDLEQGKPGVAMAMFFAVLNVLGMDLDLEKMPQRGPRIRLNEFPELRQLAWNRMDAEWIDEPEALALYERNWRHVDHEHMAPEEQALLDHLIKTHGGGTLHV